MPKGGGDSPGDLEGQEQGVFSDVGGNFEEELREFLEGDLAEADADPLFRERLRRKLWATLLQQISDSPGGDD